MSIQGKQKIPGISVSIVKDGELVYSKGFGYANIELKTKVKPDETLFRIASISKTLTSALMARLQQFGYIHPDTSLYTYCSWFPSKNYDFSIGQLACHTAGIRSYLKNEFYSDNHYSDVKSAISIFEKDSLLFLPQSKYFYSSYGWNLLSLALEEAVKIPYLKLMQDSVFIPLSLSRTFPDDKFEVSRNKIRSGYYKHFGDTIKTEPDVDLSNKWAGGGFESTSENIAWFGYRFWFSGYLSDQLINEYTRSDTLSNGKPTNYGYGWLSGTDFKGRKWFGHSGGGVGARAMLIVFPEERLSICILTNISKADLKSLYFSLADIYMLKQ